MKDISQIKHESISPNSERVVRATFSLPSSTIIEIDKLRKKLAKDGHVLNKSEIVRVGLVALEHLSSRSAMKAIGEIERLKAGRPHFIEED
jgi:hypothetical protein